MKDTNDEFLENAVVVTYETEKEHYIRFNSEKWSIVRRDNLNPIGNLVYLPERFEYCLQAKPDENIMLNLRLIRMFFNREQFTEKDLKEIDKKTKNYVKAGGRLIGIVSSNKEIRDYTNSYNKELFISEVIRKIERIHPNIEYMSDSLRMRKKRESKLRKKI